MTAVNARTDDIIKESVFKEIKNHTGGVSPKEIVQYISRKSKVSDQQVQAVLRTLLESGSLRVGQKLRLQLTDEMEDN